MEGVRRDIVCSGSALPILPLGKVNACGSENVRVRFAVQCGVNDPFQKVVRNRLNVLAGHTLLAQQGSPSCRKAPEITLLVSARFMTSPLHGEARRVPPAPSPSLGLEA